MSTANDIQQLQSAFALQQRGQLREAAEIYTNLISRNPQNFYALHFLGLIEVSSGNFKKAKLLLQRSLAIQPPNVQFLGNYAAALLMLGEFDAALEASRKGLAIDGNNIDLLYASAVSLYKLKQPEESLAQFDRLLAFQPGHLAAINERGSVLAEMGRFEEALASFHMALQREPRYAEAHLNKGNALSQLKRDEEAVAAFDQALALKPALTDAWLGRGHTLLRADRKEEALAAYEKAVSIEPTNAEVWIALGNALFVNAQYEEAFEAFDRAVNLNSDQATAWYGRGDTLYKLNEIDEAKRSYEKALTILPDMAAAKFARCFAELPILYRSEEEIRCRRDTYEKRLRELLDEMKRGTMGRDVLHAAASKLPFQLAYQGLNDRELQKLHGSLLHKIVTAEFPAAKIAAAPALDEPIRVGFVSAFFNSHSNWTIPIQGWLKQLNRERFRVFGYHLGTKHDAETDKAAALCERFVKNRASLREWREEILADAPHVLLYPGLEMDATSILLAAQRLAPVQCNSLGHPDTCGLPTMDFYLSSDLMEPHDGQDHYTEQLIRLPNLSIYYEQLEPLPYQTSRAQLGLRKDAVVFWSGQSLFKYLPQHDHVFAKIAKQAGDCQFVFLQSHDGKRMTKVFEDRLDRAFASEGIKASDYCIFLPRLSYPQFLASMGVCDIFLDSLWWSGNNSAMESLMHSLPIVTMDGPHMRGRHTAGILRRMEIFEPITKSVEEYISAAVRFARYPDERRQLKDRIAARKARVYRDRECIAALENFLEETVRKLA